MPHPCKPRFWGPYADCLLDWCDFLDGVGPQSARTLSEPTWLALTAVVSGIQTATLCAPKIIPPWLGGGDWDETTETDLRELCNVFVALLAADEWDSDHPNPHAAPGTPGWMRTAAPANPDPLAITQLVGASVMPGMPASMESLIGRIRGSLGS